MSGIALSPETSQVVDQNPIGNQKTEANYQSWLRKKSPSMEHINRISLAGEARFMSWAARPFLAGRIRGRHVAKPVAMPFGLSLSHIC